MYSIALISLLLILPSQFPIPFSEGFESAPLPPYWEISTSNDGQVLLTYLHAPHSGGMHAVLHDAVQDLAYSQASLTLTAELARYDHVVLTFWAKEFGDEPHYPKDELGSVNSEDVAGFGPVADFNFDGVAVSADVGLSWYEVRGLRDLSSAWREITIDLDPILDAIGLEYTETFLIRFCQYDNHPAPSDGIALDDITLAGDTAFDPDTIWIDYTYLGEEHGTETQPFNTLPEAIDAVNPGGTILIKSAPALITEAIRITNPLRIKTAE